MHVNPVRQILQRLLDHHLYVKVETCQFHQNTISFLGYCISLEGVRMQEDQFEAVRQWPISKTIKEINCLIVTAISEFCEILPQFHSHHSLFY